MEIRPSLAALPTARGKGPPAIVTGCEMVVAGTEVNKCNAGNGDIVKMSFPPTVFTPLSYRRNVVVSFLTDGDETPLSCRRDKYAVACRVSFD